MFGLGFTEILVILIIAILFLGPDKLPSAMVDIAKFFRSVKKTVGTVKDTLEQEMSVADIKQEALAYKKELLQASEELNRVTNLTEIGESLTHTTETNTQKEAPKAPQQQEKVTFEKKPKENI